MSMVENLLRLHRWQLEERRRYLGELESLAERLRADAQRLATDFSPDFDSLALGNPARCMRLDFSSDERWNAAATRPASVIG